MGKKFRVAVIGHTGKGNYGHGVDGVWLKIDNAELVGVADADPNGRANAVKRLKAPKSFAKYQDLLEETKPDIVSICPRWLDQHQDMVVAAASRGIHIFMEKPMCRTLQEADEMIAVCEKNNVKLALAHQTRYSPLTRLVRNIIEDGTLGDVIELRGRGKEDHRGGGEDLWVLGSHIMNLMYHFAGEPNWCSASVSEKSEPVGKQHVKQGKEGIGLLAGDTVNAMYGMSSGTISHFASRRNMRGQPSRFGLSIFGSKGVVEILTGYVPSVQLLKDSSWSPGRSGKKWVPVSSNGIGKPETIKDRSLMAGNVVACQDLMAAIEQDRHPECNGYEGRMTVEMIASVFESHRLGTPVKLPMKNRKNPLSLLPE